MEYLNDTTSRFTVPGGWIYRNYFTSGAPDLSAVFVPTPPRPTSRLSEVMDTIKGLRKPTNGTGTGSLIKMGTQEDAANRIYNQALDDVAFTVDIKLQFELKPYDENPKDL